VTSCLSSVRARVYLFGSTARGDPGRASDIDVAILPLEPISPGLLASLREHLDESSVLYTVDVVNLADADPAFKARVEREGILWSS
jgi:predicted nucleotidyltransferase